LRRSRRSSQRSTRRLSDACAVVLRNATPGEHTVAVTVRPRSFDDPQMHVAIAQLMVV